MVDYIMESPEIAKTHLTEIYKLIKEMIGDKTTKVITYQMPTYKAKKNVVQILATKNM